MGKVNPSGKLAESWPLLATDNPSAEYFPGYPLTVEYREGLFVGYRYYDTAHQPVRFPFGYGLSYTQFEYSNLKVSSKKIKDTESLRVSCTVTNIGKATGSEIVQLYVACRDSVIIRPVQELKGFEKVQLSPGESREVSFTLTKRDFAYYNVEHSTWHVESADYKVRIAVSSQDIRLSTIVHVESTQNLPLPDLRKLTPAYYDLSKGIRVSDAEFSALLGKPLPPHQRKKGTPHTINSTFSDIQDKWLGRLFLRIMRVQIAKTVSGSPDMKIIVDNMLLDMPLRFLILMAGNKFTITMGEGLVDMLNGHLIRGLKTIIRK
jgi:beta-glucosidase